MITQTAPRRAAASDGEGAASTNGPVGHAPYVLPVVHVRLPERAVEAGFWGALAGTAVFGVVDPPLAVLIGGAVLVARHRARSRT